MASAALSVDDGCRLCLAPFVETCSTIESPTLKEQMHHVFNFPIEFISGWSSSVCEACTYIIAEFYQYSKNVRKNQDILIARDSNLESHDALLWGDMHIDEELQGVIKKKNQSIREANNLYELRPKLPTTDEALLKPKNDPSDQKQTQPCSCKKELANKVEDPDDKFLREHMTLICDICSVEAPNFKGLIEHFENAHRSIKAAYVTCCNKKFYSRARIISHIRHEDHRVCFQCKISFKNKLNLIKHQFKEHYVNKKPANFVCNQCNMVFLSAKSSKLHVCKVQTELSAKSRRQCKVCNRWVHLRYYKLHMEQIHGTVEENAMLIKCDHCPQYFSDKFSLGAHMQRHQNECPECSQAFTSQIKLNKHMVDQHRLGFICDYCGKHFVSRTPYELHVNVHKGIEAPQALGQ